METLLMYCIGKVKRKCWIWNFFWQVTSHPSPDWDGWRPAASNAILLFVNTFQPLLSCPSSLYIPQSLTERTAGRGYGVRRCYGVRRGYGVRKVRHMKVTRSNQNHPKPTNQPQPNQPNQNQPNQPCRFSINLYIPYTYSATVLPPYLAFYIHKYRCS